MIGPQKFFSFRIAGKETIIIHAPGITLHYILVAMYPEVLTDRQNELLALLSAFADEYYLVGGTAIALHIGHRRSIDFDLFTSKSVQRMKIRNFFLRSAYPIEQVLYEEAGQLHIISNSVKITFYAYPYIVQPESRLPNGLSIPSLRSLAAMKALALGGRAKWKDYVDLYFLLRYHFSVAEIKTQAQRLFHDDFNEKLFYEQLAYFDDIDFSEEVDYLKGDPGRRAIEEFLVDTATSSWHE